MRWKPGEGRMMYNRHACAIIQQWFKDCGRQPLYIGVLSAVFKEAWREKEVPMHSGDNYLAISRNYRNREWRHGAMDGTSSRISADLVPAMAFALR